MNENEYDMRMLNDTLMAIDKVVQVYDNNKKVINDLQVKKTVNQARGVLKDINIVNTVDSKKVLCSLLDDMLADILVRVSELEKFVELSSKEIMSLHGKIPMSKQKVQKILKAFGFHDYSIGETTAGNLADIRYKEQMNNADKISVEENDNEDNDSKNTVKNKESITDEQIEKLYDEISGNELDDPDVKEEDIKEITPEQFMNVLDDTKRVIDEARKNAKESKRISKKEEDKSFKSKKRRKRNK